MTRDDEIAALLLRNEQSLLEPAVRRERALLLAYLAEDFIEFGSSGRVWRREEIADLLAAEDFQPSAIEEFHCSMLAPDVALVTYRTVRVTSATSGTLRSSIWIRGEGRWRMRFHQGTPAGQRPLVPPAKWS